MEYEVESSLHYFRYNVMTIIENVEAQLPSILVGDGVLLPVKIDITMSGNIFCWLPFDYSLSREMAFTELSSAVLCPRCKICGHVLLETLQFVPDP